MKRILVLTACGLAAAALLLLGRMLLGQSMIAKGAVNLTPVCGQISSDTTWTTDNSPYEVCAGGATVAQDVTLTVQPGVTVQFQQNSRLMTNGTLMALGTPVQPITFTGVITNPGSWVGILAYSPVITAPAQVSLDYATVEYAGLSLYSGAQVSAENAALTVTHSLIRAGAGSGMYVASSAHLEAHDNLFINNSNDAIRLIQPLSELKLSGLSATGNGRDAILIAGSIYLSGQHHLPYPGLPYIIDSVIGNHAGDSFSIDPGNELQFTSSGWLNIGGEFKAIGLPGEPITLTGEAKTRGTWIGLVVYGGQEPANAQLEYATVEYGGRNLNGANIGVTNGYLIARNSIIRHSQYDGVRIDSRGHGSLLNSQIVSNALYGVRNTAPTSAVLATNNWWGDPGGPASDLTHCSDGLGDRVTAGVLFRPVLTDTNITTPFPLSDAPIITLTPNRWFAPANGTSRIYFDITLVDGNGAPLRGRIVRLSSSMGTLTNGGITDVRGHTRAYLVSSSVGDAEVTAALDVSTSCEETMSPTAKVTFTTPIDVTELFPDSPASYFDGNISVTPLPVVVGVTSTMQARLTNPLTVPITVDVTFGFAHSGIGLVFGPIREFLGQVIPAGGSVLLSASWLPVISGHYCVQANYTITAIGTTTQSPYQGGGSGLQRMNLDARPAPMGSPSDKAILNKADKAWNAVSKMAPRGTNIQTGLMSGWWSWAKGSSSDISQNLGGDPPRQDYDQFTEPVWYTWPAVQPDANISAERAAAINAVSTALADVNAYGAAAALALDRYGGASEANDLIWAAQQANARLYLEYYMGGALLTYADNLDAFVQLLIDEGETNTTISISDVTSYQQDLAAQGFTAQEIADAKLIGWTDADIEEFRQEIIAADPDDLAGDVLDFYTEEAAISRELGYNLLESYAFLPSFDVGGGAGLLAADAGGNTLAQIYNTVATLQVGNPLTQTAVIDLLARRIDLPADWAVSVSPAQVSLAPGEQATVTVTVLTGSLVQQGSRPRLAVEGYVGDELLSGVVLDIVVPRYVLYDGNLHVYLPMLSK